ncbi:ferredoxin [Kitasatospora sp. NPDC008050]|uniref:ferredoxin n=1 Tax=Kitasatospora sp. NPDC008050 TaxID=3364021 RepID=UPI0036E87BE5
MEADVEISVDQGLCQGAAQCLRTAPELFDQGDDGLVVLLRQARSAPERAAAREAALLCPAGVITTGEPD